MQGKVKRSAQAPVYVGIDVSKARLDVYLHPLDEAFQVANSKPGWKAIKRRLKGHQVERVVVEATGKYHRGVHRSLSGDGYCVAVINPFRSRRFGEALGVLAKSDARVLALSGEALKPGRTAPAPKSLEEMPRIDDCDQGLQSRANGAWQSPGRHRQHRAQALSEKPFEKP